MDHQEFRSYLKSEFSGWKRWEIAWLALATAVILGLSLFWKDNWISLTAAVTGEWCVILTGKGKRSSFIFGTVNVIFYALISLKAKYYGEVMLNLLYYLPVNFVGWFAWKKHMNPRTHEVEKTRLSRKSGALIYGLTAVAIVLYGLLLKAMGGSLPFMDSLSTVVSVTAAILSIKRLREQWVLWIVVDAVTVIMWAVNFLQGGETVATLAMWSVYLANAVIMFVKWDREAKQT